MLYMFIYYDDILTYPCDHFLGQPNDTTFAFGSGKKPIEKIRAILEKWGKWILCFIRHPQQDHLYLAKQNLSWNPTYTWKEEKKPVGDHRLFNQFSQFGCSSLIMVLISSFSPLPSPSPHPSFPSPSLSLPLTIFRSMNWRKHFASK